MVKVTFLGTSSMLPTKDRNHNAIFLRYKNEGLLIDCGEGTQRQFRLANIPTTKVTKLLITHFHGDHTLGILGLIQSLGANNYKQTLEIYGPKDTKKYIKHMMSSIIFKNKIKMEIHEISKLGKFFENKDFTLESTNLKHAVPCLGYS
ncbi:ribonuclease Z, partial [archaeon]|nr:ribonuclease Z [archaeon]